MGDGIRAHHQTAEDLLWKYQHAPPAAFPWPIALFAAMTGALVSAGVYELRRAWRKRKSKASVPKA